MVDYLEDQYFLKYKDKILDLLKFYHNFEKYEIKRHYKFYNKEFDVLIFTPRLKIGIELKEYNNVYKVFEQAIERLPYVNYQYVLIGSKSFVPFNIHLYLSILDYYKSKLEDLIKIGIIVVVEDLDLVWVFKKAYTDYKAKKVEGILKYLLKSKEHP